MLVSILTELMSSRSISRHAQRSVLFLFTLRLIQAKGMKKESKGDIDSSQEMRKERKREKIRRTEINRMKKKHEIELGWK